MKNTIIIIAILIGQSLGISAQTIQYQYDDNGNRTEQKSASCSEETPSTQTQKILLDKGWNLVSTYIQPTDYTTEKVFSTILREVLKIKNQADSYDPTIANAFNTLKAIEDGTGYLVNMERSTTLSITGNYNPNNNTTISLKKGWNLIGYPYAQAQAVETAFLDIQPILKKVKSSFESYDPSLPPAFNTLSHVESGKGYWVKVSEAMDFVYPQPTATSRSIQDRYITQRDQQNELINWQPISYPTSMIAYGQVTLDGQPIIGTAMIGAFVGQACRATALIQSNEAQTISSLVINGSEKEKIQFLLYQNGQVYPTTFTQQLQVGKTPTTLLPLAFTSNENKPVDKNQVVSINPNPFVESLKITLHLSESTFVDFTLYDTKGQKIATKKVAQLNKGYQIVHWDLQDVLPQLTMGIYYLEIKTNQKIYTQKIIFQP